MVAPHHERLDGPSSQFLYSFLQDQNNRKHLCYQCRSLPLLEKATDWRRQRGEFSGLLEYSTDSCVWGIHLYHELMVGIWVWQDGRGGKHGLQKAEIYISLIRPLESFYGGTKPPPSYSHKWTNDRSYQISRNVWAVRQWSLITTHVSGE